MARVDCHVHLYPPEVAADPRGWGQARGEALWTLLCTRVRKTGQPVQAFPDVETLLRAMDAAEIDRAILQGWYWENQHTADLQNEFFARCMRAYPDRLSACATLHAANLKGDIAGALAALKEAGFVGIGELSPHSQNIAVDSVAWSQLVQEAGRVGLPLLLHVTEPVSRNYPGRVLTPLSDFVALAERFPQTTFVLAHWGARLPLDPTLGEQIRRCRNVFYDTAASPLLYDSAIVAEMMNAVGADRILFGSDYPLILFPREETEPAISSFARQLRSCPGLDVSGREAIFSLNAKTVFGLPG
jgi:uncharacterized protein